MNSIRIYVSSVFVIAIVATSLYYFFNYEGPLESIKMDDVYIERGESLESAASKIEGAIREKGSDWRVDVEEELKSVASKSGFGGGGSAIFAGIAAEQYGCEYVVVSDKRVIKFVSR